MTAQEAREILRLLLAVYPTQRQRMNDDDLRAMAAGYAAGLADVDAGEGRAAVNRLVKTSQWIPTIAELRAAVGVVTAGARKTGGEAWGEALALVKRYGSHRRPELDFDVADPLIAKAIRSFGWSELCVSDNSVADRARFIELYDQLSKHERTEAAASHGARLDAPKPLKQLAPAASPMKQLPPAERSLALREAIAEALASGQLSDPALLGVTP